MCRLFESIKLEDGVFHNASLHEARMLRSVNQLFGVTFSPDIRAIVIPEAFRIGLYKCRVVYQQSIESIEFVPYKARTISSVRIVRADEINYAHKYLDREIFRQLLAANSDCDEIIIEQQGRITDSTYSNLAFFDGLQWFTPARPLLEGTRRRALLDSGQIISREITANDLAQYSLVSFINAMTDLREVVFPMNGILP